MDSAVSPMIIDRTFPQQVVDSSFLTRADALHQFPWRHGKVKKHFLGWLVLGCS